MKPRLFFVACLVAALPGIAPAQPASARLTILHSNDTHGHLLPFLKTKGTLAPAYDGRRVVIGGRNRSGG